MTLQELCLKYSFKDLQSMPGDENLRYTLFSPILNDLYENKIIYYERFICVAIIQDIKITHESFRATAIPYIKIERIDSRFPYYPEKPWTFGARWSYMTAIDGHFGTYGMWQFWTDKDLVRTVEEHAKKKEFETALELTYYKGCI